MRGTIKTELVGGPLDGLAMTVATNVERIEIVHPSFPSVRAMLGYELAAWRDAKDGAIRIRYVFTGRVPIPEAAETRGA